MKVSLFSLIWLLLISTSMADSPVLPKPVKYVTDKAGVLKDGGSALNEQLKKLQDDTTAQLLVYIDKKLPANTTIEDVAVQSFRSWGVGQKDKNNGIALFVFVDDRKMRLEVGYGMEGRIPDLVAKRVLDTMLKPAFKQQRYGDGVSTAVAELQRLVRAESGIKTESAAGSKESQRGPFGGSASSLPLSSSSASTAPSSASSSSNSSVTSSVVLLASPARSSAAEEAAVAVAPPPTGTELWFFIFGLPLLIMGLLTWYSVALQKKRKAAAVVQAEIDRQLELLRQREEAARQRRYEAQKDSVLFQPIPRSAPMPKPSSTPIVKHTSKPLVAAGVVAGVAALSAAELARRRRQQQGEDEAEASRRRRRQQEDEESSRRSSSWASSSSDYSSSSSSSSYDSGGGSSGGGGASSDW